MTQKEFLKKVKAAAKEFAGKKKAPTTADKQFEKGALWAFEVLMLGRTVAEYEATLRQDVCDRFQIEVPEQWQELLISETAAMMADRDGMQADILKEGRLIEKFDKNLYSYKESNPLYVHLKELQRSIGMQREHLGLTAKSAKKMESPRGKCDKSTEKIDEYLETIQG
jgi:hypothetical protein